jgi:hypothetical protein
MLEAVGRRQGGQPSTSSLNFNTPAHPPARRTPPRAHPCSHPPVPQVAPASQRGDGQALATELDAVLACRQLQGQARGQAGRSQADFWWGSGRQAATSRRLWSAGRQVVACEAGRASSRHAPHIAAIPAASRAHPSASWTGRLRTGTAGPRPRRAPHPWTAADCRRAQTRCPRTQSSCAHTAAGRGQGVQQGMCAGMRCLRECVRVVEARVLGLSARASSWQRSLRIHPSTHPATLLSSSSLPLPCPHPPGRA